MLLKSRNFDVTNIKCGNYWKHLACEGILNKGQQFLRFFHFYFLLSFCSVEQHNLRTISGISHAHHTCDGKRGKFSGSRLSDHLQIRINTVSDMLMMDITTFS